MIPLHAISTSPDDVQTPSKEITTSDFFFSYPARISDHDNVSFKPPSMRPSERNCAPEQTKMHRLGCACRKADRNLKVGNLHGASV